MEEIDRVVAWLQAQGLPLAVFQCTSRYPSPPETIGLNMLEVFRQRYGVPVGLSDHSAQIYAGLAAATLGADLLEVHVTLSREAFGPDVIASLTTAELRQLVEGVRFIERTLAHPVDKDANAAEMDKMRRTFGKALVLRRDLPAGHRLTKADLTARKPASAGIPAAERDAVLGRALRRACAAGHFLTEEDLEQP
jgi:N-acetylneuraminate synthase